MPNKKRFKKGSDKMSLKLYRITTTLNHPDYGARFKKNGDEIFSFFRLDIGDEEKIKKRRLDFIAGAGYTLENIEKTDYIDCSVALLFSKRFVEKVGNVLREEMQFFSCNLICQDVNLDWYAAKIIRSIPIIDKEASTYRTLSDGEKILKFVKYRKDIEEQFFIAKDKESITDFVVSELFRDLCKKNDLLVNFEEPELFQN